MTDETYQGWTNRETWNTALWVNNEEPLYNEAREIVHRALVDYEPGANDWPQDLQRAAAIGEAASALEDWYAETFETPDAGPVADAWAYALARTDWREIAEGMAEDWPDPPDTDEDEDEE